MQVATKRTPFIQQPVAFEARRRGDTLLDMIREEIGEEALVLWDQLEVEIDMEFKGGNLWPYISTFRGDDINNVKMVMVGGRYVAAWVFDHWIKRERPFEARPDDSETFREFTVAVEDEIKRRGAGGRH